MASGKGREAGYHSAREGYGALDPERSGARRHAVVDIATRPAEDGEE
jgi:hypothetical protein